MTNSATHVSLGSVVGTLTEVEADGRTWLVADRDGQWMPVQVAEGDRSWVAAHAGRRVEAWGRLTRDSDDQPIELEARRFDLMPGEGPPVTALRGLIPDLTGGLSVDAHIRRLRGPS